MYGLLVVGVILVPNAIILGTPLFCDYCQVIILAEPKETMQKFILIYYRIINVERPTPMSMLPKLTHTRITMGLFLPKIIPNTIPIGLKITAVTMVGKKKIKY